jgi:hypothetical protein
MSSRRDFGSCGSVAIEDYALLGDMSTAALVSREGSVDWLCVPRFDSPACFAALLGKPEHGRWLLAPAATSATTRRRYRDETLVLETDHETEDGSVTVIDTMPPTPASRRVTLVRIVVGRRGRVPMRMQLAIRYGYGLLTPWLERVNADLLAVCGPDALRLATPVEVTDSNGSAEAEFSVAEGQRLPFVLTWFPSHEPGPPHLDAEHLVTETERWWRDWAQRCTYDGEWREAVVRSLLTLRALTYEPTGGLVAAPTTSLPELLGGGRNWDYRFCWLRDATFTLAAMHDDRTIGSFRGLRRSTCAASSIARWGSRARRRPLAWQDHPADDGRQRRQGHDYDHREQLPARPPPAQRAAANLPGRWAWIPRPVPGAVRRPREGVPQRWLTPTTPIDPRRAPCRPPQ